MNAIQSDEFRRPRNLSFVADARFSRLALGALICSLLLFVPFLPLVGVLLGLAAWRAIGRSSLTKGRPIALAAVALGALSFAGQLAIGFTAHGFTQRANHGPQRAIAAGFSGNTAAFVGAFHPDGDTANEAEARSFVEQLRERYGDFIDGQIVQPVSSYQVFDAPGDRHLYRLFFLNRSVMAEAAVVVFDDQGVSWPSNRLRYIKVSDSADGDLVFPAPARMAQK